MVQSYLLMEGSSVTKISLLLSVRITEEKFSNYIRFFQSIYECADDLGNLEVLVKFDDDQDLTKALAVIEDYKQKGMKIKHLVMPRGKGYAYFSYFMLDLTFISDPESKAFCALTIDFNFIKKGFDTLWIAEFDRYEDGFFVIHQKQCSSLLTDVTDLNRSFQHVDNAPVVSRKWIETQGTYGYNSSCDGYIGMVEYFLFKEYGIDRRIDLSHLHSTEETDKSSVDSDYWQGPRRKAMEMNMHTQTVAYARQAARNLAFNITNSWKKDDYVNYLIQSCLNTYDKNLALDSRINYYLLPDLQRLNEEMNHINSLLVKAHAKHKLKNAAFVSAADSINAFVDRLAKNDKTHNLFKRLERSFKKRKDKIKFYLESKK